MMGAKQKKTAAKQTFTFPAPLTNRNGEVMHISKTSATQIVEEISKLVKQNINLMDETGHIIASCDKSRIGSYHNGAYRIISENLDEYYIEEDDLSVGVKKGINPFDYGSVYTDIMKTQALKQALNKYGFTAAFGGGRRDEEKSRAKERIFSFRNENQAWDPKNQRPEMWKLYNSRINKGESIRVFPISNWTETDIWQYIKRENIDIVPLYYADKRPVVERDGMLIMVDDDRFKLREDEKIEYKNVRFRTLGCYPLTGGIESNATTLDEIIDETLSAVSSERTTRVIDNEAAGSMERRKREGYF